MCDDKFMKSQAQEIRRMAIKGCSTKEIQAKLRITKKQLIEILESYYTEVTKKKIFDVLDLSAKKEVIRDRGEIIVVDSSYLITAELNDVEKFLAETPNIVIPGPAIEELPTDTKDEKVNCHSRRILTILFELDIQVVIADKITELDPTWKKNKDYYILVVCLKLKNQGFTVKLLSFDKEMIIKARGIGVERYPMEFPQDNVKHCNTYLARSNVIETEVVKDKQEEVPDIQLIASDESLQALQDKFNGQRSSGIKVAPKLRNAASTYHFEKPKVSKDSEIDETKPEISNDGASVRLVDNSSVDILMGVLKLVITSNGKFKEQCSDETSLYFNIEVSDIVLVFTKLTNQSIEMRIGEIDQYLNFLVNDNIVLQEGGMKKINKKYHEAIKEAFYKLLKIKLKKVA